MEKYLLSSRTEQSFSTFGMGSGFAMHPFSEAGEPLSKKQGFLSTMGCHAVCRATTGESHLLSSARPPVTNESVCSVCQEPLLWEQRRLVMNYSSRGECLSQPLGIACKGTPCNYQAQVPRHKIIIISNNSCIYLGSSSYNTPC